MADEKEAQEMEVRPVILGARAARPAARQRPDHARPPRPQVEEPQGGEAAAAKAADKKGKGKASGKRFEVRAAPRRATSPAAAHPPPPLILPPPRSPSSPS
jgi:hypothetical protein